MCGGVTVQVQATNLGGVKLQNPSGLDEPGRMWGRPGADVQEARDTRHLCGLGLCASTSWVVKFLCRK